MKKIFQIAGYDFKRLMFNPFTIVTMILLVIGVLILGATIKIPASQSFEAVTFGETVSQISETFHSNAKDLDTKAELETLLQNATTHIDTISENSICQDYTHLLEIKASFSEIEEEFDIPIEFYDRNKYISQNNIQEIINASDELKTFVAHLESCEPFETNLVLTHNNFETLKNVSEYFDKIVHSGKSVREIVEDIYSNTDKFDMFSPEKLITTWRADAEKLEELKSIVENAKTKTKRIDDEILSLASSPSANVESVQTIKNLITNYKITCEGTDFIVRSQLSLLLSAHFGDLDNLLGYSRVSQEDLTQKIANAKIYVENESIYFTPYQAPLNFNEGSYQVTAFDNTYFIMSIIGFITILFGIFCAYKLYGLDRRNGKMDVILSQNVTFSQVFSGKFTAIILCTSFILGVFTLVSLVWALLFFPTLPNAILATFNLSTPYFISPFLFLLIKLVGIELQVAFWTIITIFLMNISRKFEVTFAISLLLFIVGAVCNIFINNIFVYCLFPFLHADLTAFLGGGSMNAGFLQTVLYSNGNFFISLAYYMVVVILLYNFTNSLFKKN